MNNFKAYYSALEVRFLLPYHFPFNSSIFHAGLLRKFLEWDCPEGYHVKSPFWHMLSVFEWSVNQLYMLKSFKRLDK